MSIVDRVVRHSRLSWQNLAVGGPPNPPFLILFITSTCNLTCEHCFYWRNLNQKDDLTFEEIETLSRELGEVENLNLGGGEPFLRNEFAQICSLFIRNNAVKQIYCPSSGYFTEKTVKYLTDILDNEPTLQLFAVELSLDGTQEYHNKFRGNNKSFQKAMETYDALVKLQERDPRLRIHSISTATSENMEEIRNLSTYLYERCPAMDHHNLALIRGDRKNPGLQDADLSAYTDLYRHVRQVWGSREEKRFGASVEPMLQCVKIETARERKQIVPCRAGILSAVVYANGDISVCETHEPLGNLRQKSFSQIWRSPEADQLRRSIAAGDCYCTNEIFLWPSIVFQPVHLAKSIAKTRMWK